MRKQLLVIFLFLSPLSYGQTISISGLKPAYKKGQLIEFAVENKSDSTLTVSSFMLEKYESSIKEWYEQVYDMLAINCKELAGKQVLDLEPNSSKLISWNPRKVYTTCFDYKKNSGRYRLVFIYRRRIHDRGKYYLKEFSILN